jgi:hypothetical protein
MDVWLDPSPPLLQVQLVRNPIIRGHPCRNKVGLHQATVKQVEKVHLTLKQPSLLKEMLMSIRDGNPVCLLAQFLKYFALHATERSSRTA